MLYWAAVFLMIALIAGFLGFGGVAGAAAGIAKILFFIFLVVFLISLVFGWLGLTPPVSRAFLTSSDDAAPRCGTGVGARRAAMRDSCLRNSASASCGSGIRSLQSVPHGSAVTA